MKHFMNIICAQVQCIVHIWMRCDVLSVWRLKLKTNPVFPYNLRCFLYNESYLAVGVLVGYILFLVGYKLNITLFNLSCSPSAGHWNVDLWDGGEPHAHVHAGEGTFAREQFSLPRPGPRSFDAHGVWLSHRADSTAERLATVSSLLFVVNTYLNTYFAITIAIFICWNLGNLLRISLFLSKECT